MKNKKVGIFRWIWYAVLGFLIVGYILMPFFQTVLQAVQTEDGYSLQVFGQFFSNPNQRKVIGNTVVLGVLSVFTCGVIGIMLAMYMTFLVGKWKKVIHILLLSPMMIPGVITVIVIAPLVASMISKGILLLSLLSITLSKTAIEIAASPFPIAWNIILPLL